MLVMPRCRYSGEGKYLKYIIFQIYAMARLCIHLMVLFGFVSGFWVQMNDCMASA
jgi:hypothetical protein